MFPTIANTKQSTIFVTTVFCFVFAFQIRCDYTQKTGASSDEVSTALCAIKLRIAIKKNQVMSNATPAVPTGYFSLFPDANSLGSINQLNGTFDTLEGESTEKPLRVLVDEVVGNFF